MANSLKLNTPKWQQKLQWVANPVQYMENAKQQHPEIFAAEIIGFGDSLIFVNNPTAIQEILTSKKFSAPGEVNGILKPLVGNNSILVISGDRHKKHRQLLLPPFHGERMKAYGDLINNLTDQIFKKLPLDQTFSARQVTQQISLQVILEAVFGLYEGARCMEMNKLLTRIGEMFSSPLSSSPLFFPFLQKDLGAWSPWGKFVRDREAIDQLIYAEIADRRKEEETNRVDILSLMMSARDAEGNPMSDQELRDELMTLMFAGHETTATAMAWTLYWVHHLPEVKTKLLAELDSLGDNPDPVTLGRSPYLSAVCNETLRINPVAMITFPRVVKEPVELLGYKFSPNNIIVGCIYLTHHREDLYPEPKEFKPERFLDRQYTPYEFMPFGGGVRRCLGEALAMIEMKLVLAKILREYELELATNKPEIAKRRGVTLAPASGVKLILKGQRSQLRNQKLPIKTL